MSAWFDLMNGQAWLRRAQEPMPLVEKLISVVQPNATLMAEA